MEKKDIVDKIFDVLCGLTEYHHSAGVMDYQRDK